MLSPVGISSAAVGSSMISQIMLSEGAYCAVCYTNWSPRAELWEWIVELGLDWDRKWQVGIQIN